MSRQRSPRRRAGRHYKLGPLPQLTTQEILALADNFRSKAGRWPIAGSGRVDESSDLTWERIDAALKRGKGSGRGGISLAQFLSRHRGVVAGKDPINEDQLFEWAKEHYSRTGRWPKADDGAIPNSNGMTWVNVNKALSRGGRGLKKRSGLREFLVERGIIPADRYWKPDLNVEQIWKWAQAYREKIGQWPRMGSGTIESSNETWGKVDAALRAGVRNLPRSSSLRQFLMSRGADYRSPPPMPLDPSQILEWADAFFKRWGHWPYRRSGDIEGTAGETWYRIDVALSKGLRDMPGGSSITKFLTERGRIKRGARRRRYRNFRRKLSLSQIQAWAREHRARTGDWPDLNVGPIPNADGLDWRIVDTALRDGLRGLPGGSSLCLMFGRKLPGPRKPPVADAPGSAPEQAARQNERHGARRKKKAHG